MTAFAGLASSEFAIIGTDTLATYPLEHGDTQLKPRSYTCKTFLLPQFKSAFTVTGVMQIGLGFFNYIVESAFGTNIDSLINLNLKAFQKKLKLEYGHFPTGDVVGTLYLFGFSDTANRFRAFKLSMNLTTDLNWEALEGFIFKPAVDEWEDKTKGESYCDLITDLIKVQKYEDEQKEVSDQVGIGGQILCTQLSIDKQTNNVVIVSQITYQFEDFEVHGNKMIKNANR